MCVCLCVCIQCRVEGVQIECSVYVGCVRKVLKCISFPLIVVVEEGCVCVCVRAVQCIGVFCIAVSS